MPAWLCFANSETLLRPAMLFPALQRPGTLDGDMGAAE
jgi:hypothetical protein